jgi:hypothetical protein
MYGSEYELQYMRDQVEDAKDELTAQNKMAKRFVGGQLACAAVIAFSAVLNGYDALPNGGNGGIIAVCLIIWIVLIVVMAIWIEGVYDPDLASKYRKMKRDLDRAEQKRAEANKA